MLLPVPLATNGLSGKTIGRQISHGTMTVTPETSSFQPIKQDRRYRDELIYMLAQFVLLVIRSKRHYTRSGQRSADIFRNSQHIRTGVDRESHSDADISRMTMQLYSQRKIRLSILEINRIVYSPYLKIDLFKT